MLPRIVAKSSENKGSEREQLNDQEGTRREKAFRGPADEQRVREAEYQVAMSKGEGKGRKGSPKQSAKPRLELR
jgi:hypothetical protein